MSTIKPNSLLQLLLSRCYNSVTISKEKQPCVQYPITVENSVTASGTKGKGIGANTPTCLQGKWHIPGQALLLTPCFSELDQICHHLNRVFWVDPDQETVSGCLVDHHHHSGYLSFPLPATLRILTDSCPLQFHY